MHRQAGQTAKGSYIELWRGSGGTETECGSSSSHNLLDAGGGYKYFKNRANGLCIDSGGNMTTDGKMKMWTCVSHDNLRWQINTP